MNPLGIFNLSYRTVPLEEMARIVAGHGLVCMMFDPRYHTVSAGEQLTEKHARHVREVLEENGLKIVAVAGYTNLVDPDPERREQGLKAFERMIEVCYDFGTPYIATESGSLNPVHLKQAYAGNETEEAWEDLRGVLDRLLRKAEAHGVKLLIEGYVKNVVISTERAARLIREREDQPLGFVMDPFNYYSREDLNHPREAMDRIFSAIGSRSVVAHAKDVVYTDEGIVTPRSGAGKADWHYYARLLQEHTPEIPLILEHLKAGEVEECIRFVKNAFAQVEES
jgi:sugar phosphate isomerase/epimerase